MAPTSGPMWGSEIDDLVGDGDELLVVTRGHDTRTGVGDATDRTGDQSSRRPVQLRSRFVQHNEG